MENEIKLNIIEQIKDVEEIVELYKTVMVFSGRKNQRDLDSHTMQSELIPLLEKMENMLMVSLKSTKKNEKEEIEKCIEYIKTCSEKISQFVNDKIDIVQVWLYLNEFKIFIDGLVDKDEQHTTTIGQGSDAEQRKETNTASDKKK